MKIEIVGSGQFWWWEICWSGDRVTGDNTYATFGGALRSAKRFVRAFKKVNWDRELKRAAAEKKK